jgi:hypothetical protein
MGWFDQIGLKTTRQAEKSHALETSAFSWQDPLDVICSKTKYSEHYKAIYLTLKELEQELQVHSDWEDPAVCPRAVALNANSFLHHLVPPPQIERDISI